MWSKKLRVQVPSGTPIKIKNEGVCYVTAKRNVKPYGRKGKNRIFISGQTEDGRLVLGNVFIQCESRGLPLEIMIDELEKQNCLIDWIDFYESSLEACWQPETTLKKIEIALNETIGKKCSEQVILRLKRYMASKHE